MHTAGQLAATAEDLLTAPPPRKSRRFGLSNLRTLMDGSAFTKNAPPATSDATLPATSVERTLAEHALRESEEKFRAFVETTREWIWAIDCEGRHTYSNPAVKEILGYAPEELVGQNCLSFLHEEDREQMGYMLPIFIADQWGWRDLVLRWRHKDGSIRFLERNATPILDRTGRVVGFRGTDRDITERILVEQALAEERASLARRVEERTSELRAANEQLGRAARHKDEFLASMSHELRTPLNAVLGLSESLQEQIYGPLNEKQLRSLRSIEESGRHLLSLINDILDLSKIEAGKFHIEVAPVGIQSVCDASLRLVKQAALKKKIHLSATITEGLAFVSADERRLKQILVNLLSNAVKFTPEAGAVGLEVVHELGAGTIDFSVWDTGIGIAAENLPRLFQPFVQLDSKLSRQYNGTGLGLALVRAMTEMHGGTVSVTSEPGHGSRFTISLPCPTVSANAPNEVEIVAAEMDAVAAGIGRQCFASNGNHGSSSAPRILLAEDNEMNIQTIADYLEAKGYHLTTARSGYEVIEQAEQTAPELILMDIQMPELDGLEAIARIRHSANEALARTPIIALTALAMPGDREECLAAGADDYFSKPIDFKAIVAAIERLRTKPPTADMTQ
ncbi:MAG: response regulator [Verrucomicrobia bacterium]|nr:response regulator [Verrucomicrobiota bacterium]